MFKFQETMNNLNDQLIKIRQQMDIYQEEINYLNGLLVSTSGNFQEVFEDLDKNKDALKDLEVEFTYVTRQIGDLKNTKKK